MSQFNRKKRLLCTIDGLGVATVTLNRPGRHNALDGALVDRMIETLLGLAVDERVRTVVLTGAGSSFSSGADLNWMRALETANEAETLEGALRFSEMLQVLDALSLPTVARVNGPAVGAGLGLLAACDVAVASTTCTFALNEVRLGLVPAVISPYVVSAIGARQSRRYFLTAEQIDADTACRIGLVHEVVHPAALDAAVARITRRLAKGGPRALRECKELVALVTHAERSPEHALERRTAEIIAATGVSPEGREGVSAFLEKRTPAWID